MGRVKRVCSLLLVIAASAVLASSSSSSSSRGFDSDSDVTCVKGSYSCSGSGAKCDGDFFRDGTAGCSGKRCCKMPFYCVEGKCEANNVGSTCVRDADCLATYYGTGLAVCDNETHRCRTQYNAGDTCDTTSACYGDMACSSSKCVGFDEGHSCTPLLPGTPMTGATGYVCGKGLYCSAAGNCTQKAAAGEPCAASDACAKGLVCSAGACVKRFSVEDGEACTDNYACGVDSVCYGGVCTKGVGYNHISCNDDSDCVIGDVAGSCPEDACDPFSGKRYCVFQGGLTTTCRKKVKRLLACMDKAGCAPTPSSDGNTCSQTKCSAKILDVFACEENCKAFRETYGSKCAAGTILNYCPTVPTWLKIFFVFAALLVVITIIFIVYGIHVYKHKNAAYSEIASQ